MVLATHATADDRAPAVASASASAWVETEHGRVRLIAAVDGVGEGMSVPLGLEFAMAPGWKIYWRSPGDAGFPPRIDWSGSTNLADVRVLWPAPQRFTVLGFETIGYEDHVVLPLDARLTTPGTSLGLVASVDYLTCKDICVPYTVSLALRVGAGAARPGPFAAIIGAFAERVPRAAAVGFGPGHVGVDEVTLSDETPPRLLVRVRAAEPFVAPDLFVEGPAELAFAAPSVERSGDGRTVTLRVPVLGTEPATVLAGQPLTLTLIDGDRALEQQGVFAVGAAVEAPPAVMAVDRSLALIIVFALLGGLILNLMPCVLPVLSIKLLSVIGHGGGDRRRVRLGFLASAAGIAFSFLVLAAVLIALQAAGTAAGWGLQFQRPWFLIAMALVMTLFACNLWGWFEIGLPGWLATGVSVAGVGHRPLRSGNEGGGLTGHFLTGALATLLATPCSAPFLGTAIGFALASGPMEILLVFACVATGLALPYLAVAAFPGLATRLPRPGPWMTRLRRVLGLALMGTAVWLLFVLAAQGGPMLALVIAAIVLAVIVVLALAQQERFPRIRRRAPAVVLCLAIAAFLVPRQDPPVPTQAAGWQPFDPARISQLVAAGQVVFVNVTADWCLTCKVNEHLVLARDPVRGRLSGPDVTAMRGDWTSQDEGIARYLAGFGRYGIPFDAVYGPGLPAGEALPELLNTEMVLDALDRAAATHTGDRRAALARR
ncbi:MAG: protein-disulfide reductase DsbD family protein [Rhodospirillales bacterium]